MSKILLLYFNPEMPSATTTIEHIRAFGKYSNFPVWAVNTEYGFPACLSGIKFDIIVLHYTVIWFKPGSESPAVLDERFMNYLTSHESYKIAFAQDEFHFCPQRFKLLNDLKVNCLYTLVEPQFFKDTYRKYTRVPKIIYTIPGFVSDNHFTKVKKFARKFEERTIDIGYRGRELPFNFGAGSQEKRDIAKLFADHSKNLGLVTDIETAENKRLYGDDWYRFLGNCKGMLGTESGVSIFDVDDTMRCTYNRMKEENPDLTFEDASQRILAGNENNIYYRMISPRHFESAAFRNVQILYEGSYSGIMKPGRHYISLKKDWSNFDEAIRQFQDRAYAARMVEDCYDDPIGSGKYSYREFIAGFDNELASEGFKPGEPLTRSFAVSAKMALDQPFRTLGYRRMRRSWNYFLYYNRPRRFVMDKLAWPLIRKLKRVK